jgi:hypothetical protein
MLVDDVVGTGSGRYSSPRHWMPTHSRNEGSNCVSMRWRAMICQALHGGRDRVFEILSAALSRRQFDACAGEGAGGGRACQILLTTSSNVF